MITQLKHDICIQLEHDIFSYDWMLHEDSQCTKA